MAISFDRSEQLVALDDALEDLESLDQRKSRMVEMRFFGGLTNDEMAEDTGGLDDWECWTGQTEKEQSAREIRMFKKLIFLLPLLFVATATIRAQEFDIIIRGGTVYDGSGKVPIRKD